MSPYDVLRGVKRVYFVGLAVMALPFFAILAAQPLAALTFGVITMLVGLALCVPAALAALAVFYTLRGVATHVHWWMAPLVCTLFLAAVFWRLEPMPGTLIYAAVLGPIAGIAFWSGAVGQQRRAPLEGRRAG